MKTSKNYKCLLSIFREESERLRMAASAAEEAETVKYYSHMHLYLCAIYADIAEATLSTHEKDMFHKWIHSCSSQMCAIVGEFYVKSYEKGDRVKCSQT